MRHMVDRLEVSNPKITTMDTEFNVHGQTYILATQELIKIIKKRYTTNGDKNTFPYIVDDYLSGKIYSLEKIYYTNNKVNEPFSAESDLSILKTIIKNGKGIVVLSKITPSLCLAYSHADEIIEIIREIPLPSHSDIEIEDQEGKTIVISGVKNNTIVSSRGKNYSKHADTITAVSIISLVLGIAFFFARKGRFWEMGIPLFLIGAFLFYLRFFSEWGEEVFQIPQIDIEGSYSLVIEEDKN